MRFAAVPVLFVAAGIVVLVALIARELGGGRAGRRHRAVRRPEPTLVGAVAGPASLLLTPKFTCLQPSLKF
jgi:hypothetical protein